jgi:hypothetical protein
MKNEKHKNISTVRLVIDGNPLSSLGDCIKDCINIASTEWVNIELNYQGKVFNINVNDLMASAKMVSKNNSDKIS